MVEALSDDEARVDGRASIDDLAEHFDIDARPDGPRGVRHRRRARVPPDRRRAQGRRRRSRSTGCCADRGVDRRSARGARCSPCASGPTRERRRRRTTSADRARVGRPSGRDAQAAMADTTIGRRRTMASPSTTPADSSWRDRLIAVVARALARVLARPGALEDGRRLLHPAASGVGVAGSRAAAAGRRREPCSSAWMSGSVFLRSCDVRRLLAGRCLIAPDAQQVVVELEGDAQRPAEAAVGADDGGIVGGEHGAGLDRARDERRGLAADHVEVLVHRRPLATTGVADVEVLALAQREARLVVQAHQVQHGLGGEAQVGQPVQGHAREREQRVPGVDRLGHADHRPQRRPVAPLGALVLDVVVDEAEVVAHLHGCGAGQRALVLAGDRLVGQQAEQRSQPLAALGRSVEAHVVADPAVQLARAGILGRVDDAQDLGLGVRDQGVQVEARQHGNRIPVASKFCHPDSCPADG